MKEVEENEREKERSQGEQDREKEGVRDTVTEKETKKKGKRAGEKRQTGEERKKNFQPVNIINIVMQKFPEPKAAGNEFSCPFLYSLVLQR